MQIICEMVGASFRPAEAKDIVKGLTVGDAVQLVRDPSNQYDNFAVAVHSDDTHIGFIPKTHNWEIAQYLDADEDNELSATILSFNNTLKPVLEIELPGEDD